MRKLILLPLLLLCFLPAYTQKSKPKSSGKAPASSTLDLSEALAQKRVSLTITGTGGHAGERITLHCQNRSGQFLRLRIPQGLLLEPADSAMQTLVVAEAKSLAVNTKMPVEVNLKTFCTQAGDRSPSAGTRFAVGAMAPNRLCRLLQYIGANSGIGESEAQTAVWCVTNGESLAGIGHAELMKFTAGLLGKTPPGYRVHYESREVPGERAGPGKALLVESNFRYTLEKAETLSTLLLDAEGKLVKTLRENEPAAAGEHRSGLKLQAWNLKPGKYTVRVQTRAGSVIQDIEVEF